MFKSHNQIGDVNGHVETRNFHSNEWANPTSEKFFCEKKHIVSSRGHLKFFSLHKDSEDTSICSRTFLFYAVMRFIFEKGKGLKNQWKLGFKLRWSEFSPILVVWMTKLTSPRKKKKKLLCLSGCTRAD